MPNKKIKVFASFSKEYMYDKGIENGLSEKAANYFKHFNEEELVLTVDCKTGEVKNVEIENAHSVIPIDPCKICEFKTGDMYPSECIGCEHDIPF